MKPAYAITLLAASLVGVISGPAAAQDRYDYGRYSPPPPGYSQPQSNYHWGWLNGRDDSGGAGWINNETGEPIGKERGDQRAMRSDYHWGWLNGRDDSDGAGWIDNE